MFHCLSWYYFKIKDKFINIDRNGVIPETSSFFIPKVIISRFEGKTLYLYSFHASRLSTSISPVDDTVTCSMKESETEESRSCEKIRMKMNDTKVKFTLAV